jgi:hypothetical protein
MKFDNHSDDAFRQIGGGVNNAGLPNVASLTPWRKDRPAAGRTAAMLAFAAGFLVAAVGAWAADAPVRPQPTAARAGADSVRAQPTARQFAPPSQPDASDRDSIYVDELYRELIGPPSAPASGSRSSTRAQAAPRPAAPRDDAAGSIRHWASPR